MTHRIVRLPAALLLLVAVPVGSQRSAWIEYRSPQDLFSISLPAQPTVRDITYKTLTGPSAATTKAEHPNATGAGYGLELPGRVYSVDGATGRYSVTVVAYPPNLKPGPRWGSAFLMVQASEPFLTRRQATPTLLSAYGANSVFGHEVHLLNADGSRTVALVQAHEGRLYILEGTFPKGQPVPAAFPQSFRFIDNEGKPVWYEITYTARQLVPRRIPPPSNLESTKGQR